ncbi:hypothetical protein QBC44DRAFT_373425 [Cladorrhinum sp. PSN332]|nr:hypothetical protein QBC44DRAFT_373425 [Cladorrhinum sp. PSN332]
MKLSTALTLGLAAIPTIVSANFIDSCDSDWYWDGKYMIANCRKADGSKFRTRQDMNLCIGVLPNGFLYPANTGNAWANGCAGGSKVAPTSVKAMCSTAVGWITGTPLNLGSFVENMNGYLYCFGHYGAPY